MPFPADRRLSQEVVAHPLLLRLALRRPHHHAHCDGAGHRGTGVPGTGDAAQGRTCAPDQHRAAGHSFGLRL